MTALAIIIGVICVGIAIFLFVLYACCVAAGSPAERETDEEMERAIEEMRRRRDG